MTPLSNALRRLRERPAVELPVSTEASADVTPAKIADRNANFVPLSLATDLATWNAFEPIEFEPTEQDSQLPDPSVSKQSQSDKPQVENEPECPTECELPEPPALESTHRVSGQVRLYCDLSGNDQLAFLTAAQSSDLVLEARFGSYRALTAMPADAAIRALDASSIVRWPGVMDGPHRTKVAGVMRGRVDLRDTGPAERDWILFLEDCRRTYDAVGLIVSASQTVATDWLAARCDSVCLVTRAGETDSAEVRRVAARFGQDASRRPSCLVVRAA